MSKKQFLIILGVWVMGFLFLGFPSAWDKVFALVTGLVIIVMAFRSKSVVRTDPLEQMPYVEHKTIAKNPPTSFLSADVETPISNSENDIIKTDATIS